MALDLLHAFVPLFVAVDIVGIVPLYLAMTVHLAEGERRRALRASVLVAAAVSIGFALLGDAIFLFLDITVDDFQIAGGLVLLGLAGLDLLGRAPRGLAEDTDVGVVPLGVPLIAGPAVLTSTMVLVKLYGIPVTVLALAANLGVCAVVLSYAESVEWALGRAGARAVSKIVSLLLAAIAVHWIRQGLGR